MPSRFKVACLRLIVLLPIVLGLVTGCDEAREKVAAALKPRTTEDVAASVNEKIGRKDYSQARLEGVEYLNGKDDPTGKLAWALAKACAQTGDRDLAIKYTGQALQSNLITPAEAMSEPLLEPVREDIRFVSLLAGTAPPEDKTSQPATSASAIQEKPNAPSTSVTIDAKGIEARAGDVVVKLPD